MGVFVALVAVVGCWALAHHGSGGRPAAVSAHAAAAGDPQSWVRPLRGPAAQSNAAAARGGPAGSQDQAAGVARRLAAEHAAAMAQLNRVIAGARGPVAVAVLDPAIGATVSAGAIGHGFVSASIAKVDILAALLLQATDAGTHLSSWQRSLAASMIEHSDNRAADLLYRQAGSAWGVNTANRRMGLTRTSASGTHWGLTRTTVTDQLQLLRQVFTGHSALTASSRGYLQSLMSQVESDQTWGVSAASDDGHFVLKNGWLSRPDGSWVVNSMGRIDQHGGSLLIAVLCEDNASWAAGIHLIASVASAATAALPPN